MKNKGWDGKILNFLCMIISPPPPPEAVLLCFLKFDTIKIVFDGGVGGGGVKVSLLLS